MKINHSLANVLVTDDNVKLYCKYRLAELCLYLPKGKSIANKIKTQLNSLCELQEFLMVIDEHKRVQNHKLAPKEGSLAKRVIPSRDLIGRLAIFNQGTNQAYVLEKEQRFNTRSAYTAFSHKELSQLPPHQLEIIKNDLRADDQLRLEALTEKELRYFDVIELSATSELQECNS
ncbi:hypothetical protein [Vibrio jasicida]|uniref:hypothetical protein n=1 Tax=Vibrio jasicida TaxID=766224 RepID=UPI004069722D